MPILCSCFAVGAAIADKALEENPSILQRLNNGEDLTKLSKIFAKECRKIAEVEKKPCLTCQSNTDNTDDGFMTYLKAKQDNNKVIPTVTITHSPKRVA